MRGVALSFYVLMQRSGLPDRLSYKDRLFRWLYVLCLSCSVTYKVALVDLAVALEVIANRAVRDVLHYEVLEYLSKHLEAGVVCGEYECAAVCQVLHAATDPKFKGEHNDNFKKGIYVDPITGAPLFVSTDKYESGCGWPAFSKPIDDTVLSRHLDTSLNRQRIEVRSKTSNAHLGHVFTDGPTETGGLRYCINSAALKFIPFEELDEKGYGEFKKYVK